MQYEWRTLQFFLGEEGVSEVSVAEEDSTKVRCDCPQFLKKAKCKHSKWVRDRMAQNNGVFNMRISDTINDEETMDAVNDAYLFRDFVIKYGKAQVID